MNSSIVYKHMLPPLQFSLLTQLHAITFRLAIPRSRIRIRFVSSFTRPCFFWLNCLHLRGEYVPCPNWIGNGEHLDGLLPYIPVLDRIKTHDQTSLGHKTPNTVQPQHTLLLQQYWQRNTVGELQFMFLS